MSISGILGKKIGMTQVFQPDGKRIPVTLVEAGPCVVLKSYARGSLTKVQLGYCQVAVEKAAKKMTKPVLGTFKKLNIPPQKYIKEVEFSNDQSLQPGSEVNVSLFKKGDFVDICGTSIGKGFQGGMKRWNWAGGGASHGSTSHRRIGSVGQNTYPGRVFRGHQMPGHMGNRRVTTQNLEVIDVDVKENLLIIKGAVIGHDGGLLTIRTAKKRSPRVAVAVAEKHKETEKPKKEAPKKEAPKAKKK